MLLKFENCHDANFTLPVAPQAVVVTTCITTSEDKDGIMKSLWIAVELYGDLPTIDGQTIPK